MGTLYRTLCHLRGLCTYLTNTACCQNVTAKSLSRHHVSFGRLVQHYWNATELPLVSLLHFSRSAITQCHVNVGAMWLVGYRHVCGVSHATPTQNCRTGCPCNWLPAVTVVSLRSISECRVHGLSTLRPQQYADAIRDGSLTSRVVVHVF